MLLNASRKKLALSTNMTFLFFIYTKIGRIQNLW
jgi:hypothetical protein